MKLGIIFIFWCLKIIVATDIKTLYVKIGQHQNLSCTYNISITNLHSLKWFYNYTKQIVYSNGDSIVIIHPNYKLKAELLQNKDLMLYNFKSSDSGLYTCVIGHNNNRIVQAIYLIKDFNNYTNQRDNFNYLQFKTQNIINLDNIFFEANLNIATISMLIPKVIYNITFGIIFCINTIYKQPKIIPYFNKIINYKNNSLPNNNTTTIIDLNSLPLDKDENCVVKNFDVYNPIFNNISDTFYYNHTIYIHLSDIGYMYHFTIYVFDVYGNAHKLRSFTHFTNITELPVPEIPVIIDVSEPEPKNSITQNSLSIDLRVKNTTLTSEILNYSIIVTWSTTHKNFKTSILPIQTFYDVQIFTQRTTKGFQNYPSNDSGNVTIIYANQRTPIDLVDSFDILSTPIVCKVDLKEVVKCQLVVTNLVYGTPYFVRISKNYRNLFDPGDSVTRNGNFSAFKRFIMMGPRKLSSSQRNNHLQNFLDFVDMSPNEIWKDRNSSATNFLINPPPPPPPSYFYQQTAFGSGTYKDRKMGASNDHNPFERGLAGQSDYIYHKTPFDKIIGIVTAISFSVMFGTIALLMLFTWKKYHGRQKYSFLPPPSPTSTTIPSHPSVLSHDSTNPPPRVGVKGGNQDGSAVQDNLEEEAPQTSFCSSPTGFSETSKTTSSNRISREQTYKTAILPKIFRNHKRFHGNNPLLKRNYSCSAAGDTFDPHHHNHQHEADAAINFAVYDLNTTQVSTSQASSINLTSTSNPDITFHSDNNLTECENARHTSSSTSRRQIWSSGAIVSTLRSWWSTWSPNKTKHIQHNNNDNNNHALANNLIHVEGCDHVTDFNGAMQEQPSKPSMHWNSKNKNNNDLMPTNHDLKAIPLSFLARISPLFSQVGLSSLLNFKKSPSSFPTDPKPDPTNAEMYQEKHLEPNNFSNFQQNYDLTLFNSLMNHHHTSTSVDGNKAMPRAITRNTSEYLRDSITKHFGLDPHNATTLLPELAATAVGGGGLSNLQSSQHAIAPSSTNQWLSAVADSDFTDYCREIPIPRFEQYIRLMHTNTDQGFSDQFTSIVNFSRCLALGPESNIYDPNSVNYNSSRIEGSSPFNPNLYANKAKNRYANIFAYPHTRVPLDEGRATRLISGMPLENVSMMSNEGSSYVNANFIEGYNGFKMAYIATQGPLPNTIADFWRMVWNYRIDKIVMITNLVERGKVKCDRYWPNEDTSSDAPETKESIYGDYRVKHLETEKRAFYTVRTFELSKIPQTDLQSKIPTSQESIFKRVPQQHLLLPSNSHPLIDNANKIIVLSGVPKTKKWKHKQFLDQQQQQTHASVDQSPKHISPSHPACNRCSNLEGNPENCNIPSSSGIEGSTTISAQDSFESTERKGVVTAADTPLKELTEDRKVKLRQNKGLNVSPTVDLAPRVFFNKSSERDSTASYVISSSHSVGLFDEVFSSRFPSIPEPSLTLSTPNPFTIGTKDWTQDFMLHSTVRTELLNIDTLAEPDLAEERPLLYENVDNREDEPIIVKQYHYTEWPDHGVPQFTLPLLNFIRDCGHCQTPTTPTSNGGRRKSLLVHCSAGVGRTGTFFVIDVMLEKIINGQNLNIYEYLSTIRTQRNYLVQTEEQYIFIHDALNAAIKLGDTRITCEALHSLLTNFDPFSLPDNPTTFHDQLEALREFKCDFSELTLPLILSSDPNNYNVAQFTSSNNAFYSNAATAYDCSYRFSCFSGIQEYNLRKNRMYTSALKSGSYDVLTNLIVPNDKWRVYLTPKPAIQGSDYINASYLDGYFSQKDYILTQYPTPDTIQSFWRMIWENNVADVFLLLPPSQTSPKKLYSSEGDTLLTAADLDNNQNLLNCCTDPFENCLPFWPALNQHLSFEGIKVYRVPHSRPTESATGINTTSSTPSITNYIQSEPFIRPESRVDYGDNRSSSRQEFPFKNTLTFALESEEDYQLLTRIHVYDYRILPKWFNERLSFFRPPLTDLLSEDEIFYEIIKSVAQCSSKCYPNSKFNFNRPPFNHNNPRIGANEQNNPDTHSCTTNRKFNSNALSPPIVMVDKHGGPEGAIICAVASCFMEYLKQDQQTHPLLNSKFVKIDAFQYAHNYNIKRINLFTQLDDILKLYVGLYHVITLYEKKRVPPFSLCD